MRPSLSMIRRAAYRAAREGTAVVDGRTYCVVEDYNRKYLVVAGSPLGCPKYISMSGDSYTGGVVARASVDRDEAAFYGTRWHDRRKALEAAVAANAFMEALGVWDVIPAYATALPANTLCGKREAASVHIPAMVMGKVVAATGYLKACREVFEGTDFIIEVERRSGIGNPVLNSLTGIPGRLYTYGAGDLLVPCSMAVMRLETGRPEAPEIVVLDAGGQPAYAVCTEKQVYGILFFREDMLVWKLVHILDMRPSEARKVAGIYRAARDMLE